MGASPPPKRTSLLVKDIEFNKLRISKCNFFFDALFAPVLLYSSEVWGAHDSLNLKK